MNPFSFSWSRALSTFTLSYASRSALSFRGLSSSRPSRSATVQSPANSNRTIGCNSPSESLVKNPGRILRVRAISAVLARSFLGLPIAPRRQILRYTVQVANPTLAVRRQIVRRDFVGHLKYGVGNDI